MSMGWSTEDLIKCRSTLLNLMSQITDKDELLYAKEVLRTMDDIIDDFANPREIPSLSYNERLAKIERELVEFKDYYDIIDDFVIKIYGFEEQMTRIENIFKRVIGPKDSFSKITGATISDEGALLETNRFYSQFDSVLYPTFLRAFDKRENSVRVVDKLSGYNEADSFYFDFVKRYFIQLVKSKDVNKIFAFIHEYGHVLSYIVNPKGYLLQKNQMFDEVAAVFPEMLAYRSHFDGIPSIQLDFENYSSLVTVYNSANSLALHPAYVDIWKGNKRKANWLFFLKTRIELKERIKDVDESMDTYIDSCGQYIIAYSVAIELLNMYKRDKNKALEIYRNISMIPYDGDIKGYIDSEITLGSHLEEETKELLDSFEKKLLKERAFHV